MGIKVREVDIQKAILQYLNAIRIKCWRNNNAGIFGTKNGKSFWRKGSATPGLPDIQGILQGGYSLQIEVKRPGGKLSNAQEKFLAEAVELGACAFVATSVSEVEIKIKEWKVNRRKK